MPLHTPSTINDKSQNTSQPIPLPQPSYHRDPNKQNILPLQSTPPHCKSPFKAIPLKWISFMSSSVPSSPCRSRGLSSSRQSPRFLFRSNKSTLSNSSTFLHERTHSVPTQQNAPSSRSRSSSDHILVSGPCARPPFRRSPSPIKETFHINHQYSMDSPVPKTLLPAIDFPVCATPTKYQACPSVHSSPMSSSEPQLVLLINQYLVMDEIGSGSFGKVMKVYNSDDQQLYACKIISKSRLKRKFRLRTVAANSPPQQYDIRREIAVFKKLTCGHPNVTSLLEVLDAHDQDNLYMVFELCCKPIMRFSLDDQAEPYSEQVALKYFRDVVLGLDYLHSQRVIHCDLKPENILITWDDRAQISDFGIAHMCEEDDHIPNRTASPAFTPPECCQSNMTKVPGRTYDIWCLGVTLYCLTHGRVPFHSDSIMDMYTLIMTKDPQCDASISGALHGLLFRMLNKNPLGRISLPGIMVNDWVTHKGAFPLTRDDYDLPGEGGQQSVTEEDVKAALSEVGFFSRLWHKVSRRKSPSIRTLSLPAQDLAVPLSCSVDLDCTKPVVIGLGGRKEMDTIDSAYPVSPTTSLERR